MKNALFLSLLTLSQAALSFPTRFICVSWLDLQTKIHEVRINEFAMASLRYEQENWSFYADVIEGKANSLELHYKPLNLYARSRSWTYPLNQLATEIEIQNQKANVDCELR